MASNHLLLNTELARPIGIVDGTRPGGSNRRPRATCIALTDCVVTYADGSTRTIARSTTSPTTTKGRTTAPRIRTITASRADRDRAIMAGMGTIHQQD
jgi:hypothetical protein